MLNLFSSVDFSIWHDGYIQRLTGDIYSDVVANELPALLQDIPLLSHCHKYCKNDGSRAHFCKRA
jgi:hypothetical protein